MAVQHHSDIIAVSYEARALGVTKHMPTSSIRREHPSVKLVHVEVNPAQLSSVDLSTCENYVLHAELLALSFVTFLSMFRLCRRLKVNPSHGA